MDSKDKIVISSDNIAQKIFFIRGKKVMLDRDLAQLYGVGTKRINEQVRRNIKKFEGYVFQLTQTEVKNLWSQNATANITSKSRALPYVFTEHGVLMISTVLNSEKAVVITRAIIQTFIKLRELLLVHKDLHEKIKEVERTFNEKFLDNEKKFNAIFDTLKSMLMPPVKPKEFGIVPEKKG